MSQFDNLAKGTTYVVLIAAVNDVGNGFFSDLAEEETLIDRKFFFIVGLFLYPCDYKEKYVLIPYLHNWGLP